MPSSPVTGAAAPIEEAELVPGPSAAPLVNPPTGEAPSGPQDLPAGPSGAPSGGPSGSLPPTPGTGSGGPGGSSSGGPSGGPAGGPGTGPGGGPSGTGNGGSGGPGPAPGGDGSTGGPVSTPAPDTGSTEAQVGGQLAQSLLDLVTHATSGDVLEAQRIILRRIALQGDIVPSRVPAPRNISEIGGYLNLLESLGQSDMELQTLAGILGIAGGTTPQGLVTAPPPLPLTQVSNDRPAGPLQPSLPLTVSVRRDFADPLVTALTSVRSRGGVVPFLAGPVSLPLSGLAAPVRPDPLPYLGRTLTLAWPLAVTNPVTDPLLLARPSGSSAGFEPASRVSTGGTPADVDTLLCTASSCSTVALSAVELVYLPPVLAQAGFHPTSSAPQPTSNADHAWATYANTAGLVIGQTRLGDELALVHDWDTIHASVYAQVLDWVWNGVTFGVAPSSTSGAGTAGPTGTPVSGPQPGPVPPVPPSQPVPH